MRANAVKRTACATPMRAKNLGKAFLLGMPEVGDESKQRLLVASFEALLLDAAR